MEIYKDLSNPTFKEFEQLLNGQLSKVNIEEGKIIEGKINKITEKFVFLFVEGLKGGPVTPEAIVDAYINANRALFQNTRDFYRDIEAAKVLDMSEDDIVEQATQRVMVS